MKMRLTKDNIETFNNENKITELKDLTNIVNDLQENIDKVKNNKSNINCLDIKITNKENNILKEKNFIKENYQKA